MAASSPASPQNPPIDVSVVIPAWRAEDVIATAIRSALDQDGVTVEVLVVDDASPDDTAQRVRTDFAGDTRVVVHTLPQNAGPAAARNHGFARARGRYIAVLDADDAMEPGRLAALVALADAETADIVVDNLKLVDVAGQETAQSPALQNAGDQQVREIDLAEYIRRNEMFSANFCLGYLKPLFRRDTLERLALSYDASLRIAEDYYLVAHMLAAGGRMVLDPAARYRYRVAEGSISHRLSAADLAPILAAEEAFGAALAPNTLTPNVAKARQRRRRHLRQVQTMTRCVEAVKARQIGGVVAALSSNPDGAVFTAGQCLRVVREKLFRPHAPATEIKAA